MNLTDFLNKLEEELKEYKEAIIAFNKFIKSKDFLTNTFRLSNSWPEIGEKATYHVLIFEDLPHPIPDKIEESIIKVTTEMGFEITSARWSTASDFFK